MTNKKERFTPGPWFVRHNSDQLGDLPEIATESNTIICCMEDESGEDWTAKEIIANARLIAAAPEMLEALQLVVEKLSDRVFKMNVKNSFSEKLAMEAARSAISKALGE